MKLSSTLLLALLIAALGLPDSAWAAAYTIGQHSLRKGPGKRHRKVVSLDHNRSVTILKKEGLWLKVRTVTGKEGYLPASAVSNVWLKVHKKERRLHLMKGDKVEQTFPVALSVKNPLGDKVKQGDSGTPEGRFYIAEMLRDPKAPRYGARSMRLSYPNTEDARRGLKQGLIRRSAYYKILKAIRAGRLPSQKTRLGSSIRIHGGGASADWTLGCVAVADPAAIKIFDRVKKGTRVEVYKSAAQDLKLNKPGALSLSILAGAQQQLIKPALYTNGALRLIPMPFPGGDIRKDWAVCTDIIIRALRVAGLDLQALVHEDAKLHPRRYGRRFKRPNPNIDHRRARTLYPYLGHHAITLPNDSGYQAGDIVLMDTGIVNGTVFDHIGVVGKKKNAAGVPLVINIWTVGYRTAAMELLRKEYPTIVGHYRLTHLFDY
jgi:uncharacterized protein YijF (DUF1287 family)